jgi:adenosylhomocysteinase
MDLSFALQALSAQYLAEHGRELTPGVHEVPRAIDEQVAQLKLASLGLSIDVLTEAQKKYLCSWDMGT